MKCTTLVSKSIATIIVALIVFSILSCNSVYNKTHKINEEIKLSTHTLSITDVNYMLDYGLDHQGLYYTLSSWANGLVLVYIEVETKKHQISVSSNNFSIETNNGVLIDAVYIPGLSNQLFNLNLSEKGKAGGWVGFEIPINSKTMIVHYTNGDSRRDIKIDIKPVS